MAEPRKNAARSGRGKAATKKGSGSIKVERIVRKEVVDGEEQEVEFDAEVFDVPPAYVRMEVGVTRSIGEFESLRVSCAAEVPTYKERLEETKEQLAGWCADSVDTEVERYLSTEEGDDPEGEEEGSEEEGDEDEGGEEEDDGDEDEGDEDDGDEGEEEEEDEVTEEEVIEADRDELESLIDDCDLEIDPEEIEDDEELRAEVFEALFEKKLPKKKAASKGRGRSRK